MERCAQRAITDSILELAIIFGQERQAGHGCISIYIDKTAKQEIREHIGSKQFAQMESQLSGLYLIMADDKIVTSARAH